METATLQEKVTEAAQRHGVPGVAVGIVADGVEHYAYAGVTSVDNPLTVDEHTLFQFGSTGKTFTATAIMRLVDSGELQLDAPVRRYLPELKLADAAAAEAVTILHLLNHTAGWSGDLMEDTGEGDDALTRYVAKMADLAQEYPVGAGFSYNNASLSVAGRVIEVVTGETYEAAMRRLLFEPLGLDSCFFFRDEIMTRRFSVGHTAHPDGSVTVARPWGMARGNVPAGGITSTARDLVAWARFHMGDGTADDGTRVLSTELLQRMQEPTVGITGSALGDHVGISWMLRDIDDVRIVGHGGTMIGQHSSFEMVPSAGFAVSSMSNAGPNGPEFNEEIVRWALRECVGVAWVDPKPVTVGDAVLNQYVGNYETIAAAVRVTPGTGNLVLTVEVKPEVRARMGLSDEDAEQPPFVLGLLGEDGDGYVVTDGPGKGMRGYFQRGPDGAVNGVHVGGRLALKAAE